MTREEILVLLEEAIIYAQEYATECEKISQEDIKSYWEALEKVEKIIKR